MQKLLTGASVKALKAPKRGQVDIWDRRMPGFGLRVSYGGAKRWVLMYRQGGVKRRLVLGTFPELGLADARQKARQRLGEVATGQDPAQERAESKAEMSFGDLAKLYLERHAIHKRPRSQAEDRRILNHDLLPAWGTWRVSAIERRHIVALLDGIVDRGSPIQANRVKALISTIFRFAEDRELIKYNFAARLKAPAPKQDRDRVLSEDELRRLFLALEAEPVEHRAMVRIALLTAARKGEILGMTPAEFDGESWWTLPAERTKNGREHRLPLVPSVIAAIDALPRRDGAGGAFLFHGRKRRDQPSILRTYDWWPRLCERAKIKDAVFHDLRRTSATMMNKLGVDPIVVERILNHVQGGVAAVYNRHTYDHEKRAALLRWERRLTEIIAGAPAASNVVELRAG